MFWNCNQGPLHMDVFRYSVFCVWSDKFQRSDFECLRCFRTSSTGLVDQRSSGSKERTLRREEKWKGKNSYSHSIRASPRFQISSSWTFWKWNVFQLRQKLNPLQRMSTRKMRQILKYFYLGSQNTSHEENLSAQKCPFSCIVQNPSSQCLDSVGTSQSCSRCIFLELISNQFPGGKLRIKRENLG